ncbi:flippase activity-associated protein Agl23 [Kiritimatiella glycovorans]|uniref:Putative membrane protein n=1 Tax=Kiritimatiella glycovorans TaxID=1307763 RepID=A0A0G3EJT7_9BACT|nr:flippase activity-associated protein Agl23 [Kiritimatiella glycovorans]AKJ64389.1 putative membrane protein [Kiritimatiella glycovorans]
MINRCGFAALLFLLLLAGAGWARLAGLDHRPMHTDEAVQAVIFGDLLEEGDYTYDPYEYHGPTLMYATLPAARLAGAEGLASLDEIPLRVVPVVFGLLCLLLSAALIRPLSFPAAWTGALLAAVSPAFLYYNRYYIHETLLVFGTFLLLIALGRWARTRTVSAAVLAGVAAGWMIATKETAVLSYFSIAAAGLILYRGRVFAALRDHPVHGALALGSALAVTVVFYTSFFTNPEGLAAAVRSVTHYLPRAGGEGHEKPWYYYLVLFGGHSRGGVFWSEGLILGMAVFGTIRACRPRREGGMRGSALVRFFGLYALILLIVYSAIPYKIPWLMLSFIHIAAVVAGWGVVALFRDLRGRRVWTALAAVLLLGATLHLARQSALVRTRYASAPRNPYVYSHTSADLLRGIEHVQTAARHHPEGRAMTVKVISGEYWPIPWYLRGFERTGYWKQPPADPAAPVVILDMDTAETLGPQFDDTHTAELVGLRAGVILQFLYRNDLWQKIITPPGSHSDPASHSDSHSDSDSDSDSPPPSDSVSSFSSLSHVH